MKVLIQNGHVLDPVTSRNGVYDVLVEDDKIVKVEKGITAEADKVIDAEGCYVMPGFVDLHVHFRDPGLEYKETLKTGGEAAVHGGVTTVCAMPNTKPVIDNGVKISEVQNRAKKESKTNVLQLGSVTIGQMGEDLADIKGMAREGCVGISEDGKSVMNASLYRKGMRAAKEAGMIVFAHCEDITMVEGGVMNADARAEELGLKGITNAVEDVIVARDILLAKETGVQLHLCHCSTADSVKMLREAKKDGIHVTGEVCPHHFILTSDDIISDDGNFKMNPPLRTEKDRLAIIAGLKDGTIDLIATDHAPHSTEEKAKPLTEAPSGITGLETSLGLGITSLVKEGHLTLMELLEKMTCNPAMLYRLPGGVIQVNAPADFVVFDPDEIWTVTDFASKSSNSPFTGSELYGKIHYTICGGKIVYRR